MILVPALVGVVAKVMDLAARCLRLVETLDQA